MDFTLVVCLLLCVYLQLLVFVSEQVFVVAFEESLYKTFKNHLPSSPKRMLMVFLCILLL